MLLLTLKNAIETWRISYALFLSLREFNNEVQHLGKREGFRYSEELSRLLPFFKYGNLEISIGALRIWRDNWLAPGEHKGYVVLTPKMIQLKR